MPSRLLVANRGEIAVRIIRTCADLGIETVAVAASADDHARHVTTADRHVRLAGRGSAAYLDIEAIVAAAVDNGCDALHPGYGFSSESPDLARACEAAGITFVGPTSEVLETLGDKTTALGLARELGVPVANSSPPLASADDAVAFVDSHGPTMLKAAGGGGGRGMRVVGPGDDVAAAFERCRSEAVAAFGTPDVFAERFVPGARHIEVQIIGDGTGAVTHLWERDCTLQRQHQKVVEFAPAPHLGSGMRDQLLRHAETLARSVAYRSAGTFEFLVGDGDLVFIEANPRLQVEHTVTEAITGLDIVALQLAVADGATLDELSLSSPPPVDGCAVQLRINTETMGADGAAKPAIGTIERFDLPGGLGVRCDTHGHVGMEQSPAFDSLLAKIVVHAESHPALLRRARRALAETDIRGVATNTEFLSRLLDRPEVAEHEVTTETIATLAPLLVDDTEPTTVELIDAGTLVAPVLGTVVSVSSNGRRVVAGDELVILEAMKMEHVVVAPSPGTVLDALVSVGEAVREGQPLVRFSASDEASTAEVEEAEFDLDHIRPDLAESIHRHGFGLDENRADKVAKRHATGKRTARENIADLVEPGSFVEYGPLVLAAQRRRRSVEDLIERTPGDGLVGGLAKINHDRFPTESQCIVTTYDYMVMAGTQGHQNHRKKDRLFELAAQLQLPVVLFAEGGGGRPGDTDGVAVAGLDCLAFQLFAELSGHVPLIGINGGYCFAGNAALLGCCDVVIATESSNLGMGGPAMIEGGGLGVFHPTEIGPIDVQRANGVVDIVVADEAEAVAVAKTYLSYFQGSLEGWDAVDQRRLRHLIPENRLRMYDVRTVIAELFDVDSVLELRADFGLGMITALARIEGRSVGVVANNPAHLAGAITSDGADKASRFMQLCDAFGLPIVNLCDTPGIMVGPEAETTALVRHAARLFVTGAAVSVPMCTVVLRKGYGLGAQAMAGGSFKAPIFTVGWPTSEFGGMGLEGAVQLGYRDELAAIDDPDERHEAYEQMVAKMYEVGKGVSMADHFEIDDVIDPADTRRWITSAFASSPPAGRPTAGRRRFIDTW